MPELTYASFMVRLWREPAGEAVDREAPVWMGELESIQSGRAWQFQGLEPLLPLLAAQLRRQPAHLSRHAGAARLIEYNSSELRPNEPDEMPALRQSIIQNGG